VSKGSREYGRVEQLDRVFVGYKGICKDTNVLVNPEELYNWCVGSCRRSEID